jgi:macrodomain Ter protein organizer (MatP/YcbG family)
MTAQSEEFKTITKAATAKKQTVSERMRRTLNANWKAKSKRSADLRFCLRFFLWHLTEWSGAGVAQTLVVVIGNFAAEEPRIPKTGIRATRYPSSAGIYYFHPASV